DISTPRNNLEFMLKSEEVISCRRPLHPLSISSLRSTCPNQPAPFHQSIHEMYAAASNRERVALCWHHPLANQLRPGDKTVRQALCNRDSLIRPCQRRARKTRARYASRRSL